MSENNFYTYRDGTKTELCKKCLTMHVDNFDPDTFLWLLEKMDVPYIPEEWNSLRDAAFAKDPNKINGMSVFGKYLSKMKLRQWKEYRWADTQRLNEERQRKSEEEKEKKRLQEEILKQQLEEGLIKDAQYKTLMSAETLHADEPLFAEAPAEIAGGPNFYDETKFMSEDELVNPASELTADDKMYLAMKWGRLYKPNEWIELEKKYNEMMSSFDIQDSDTIGTLILICKTYLKMNQAIDCGDMDGFQKLSRVYDSLRKSAKFTAAQNKETKNDCVDSVGEIVAMCEKEGFIPRFCLDIPQDKVDVTLKDMNNYVKKLVTQDLGFGQQIEDALKKLQIQKEMRDQDDDYDFEDAEVGVLKDADYKDFYDEIEGQREKDLKTMYGEE